MGAPTMLETFAAINDAARLRDAAPDLAEACRMFVESYDAEMGTYALGKLYEAREAARLALAKARGETA